MKSSHNIPCGEVLLQLFKEQKIDCIFCSPLSVWAPLWEALAKDQAQRQTDAPAYFNCRHELLAVGMASGYYKATGRMQTALLPTSLGVLNGSMAIRGAYQERIPMLILAPDSFSFGETPSRDPGSEWPSMLGDLGGPVRISQGYVKWAKEVKTELELASAFRRASYIAQTVPRGPTLLSIPFDVLLGDVLFSPRKRIIPYPVVAPPDNLREAVEVLMASKNPIITACHAARTPHAVQTLTNIAELLGAPVFEFMMPTYRNVPRNHYLYGAGGVEAVLEDVDCILITGSDAPWHPPLSKLKPGSSVIVMEEDPMRPRASYWGYQTDYCVPGDIERNLTALLSHLRRAYKKSNALRSTAEKRAKRWRSYNEKKRKQLLAQRPNAPSSALHAAQVFQTVSEVLPKGAIIVDEIIAQLPFMMQYLFANDSFDHYRGIAGGLGTGIPIALGLKLANQKKMVVCVIGDGSFNYNPIPACFGLSQQYSLPLLIIICNNQGYASQAWNIQRYFPEGWALKSNNLYGAVIEPTPAYSKLPGAFDGYGERVDNYDALKPALKRGVEAIRRDCLAVLDILLEP